MKLRYNGNHDEVVIEDGQTVKRGATLEVKGALAKRLLEQDTWSQVTPRTPPKPDAPAPVTDDTPED